MRKWQENGPAERGREPLLGLKELHDLPGGVADRPVQIEIDPHDHVVRIVLGPTQRDGHVLMEHEAKRAEMSLRLY